MHSLEMDRMFRNLNINIEKNTEALNKMNTKLEVLLNINAAILSNIQQEPEANPYKYIARKDGVTYFTEDYYD